MQKKLIQEGKIAPNGMLISPGAIQFDPERVYPIHAATFEYVVVGYLRNVRRDDEGWILGDVDMRQDLKLEEDLFDLSAFCANLVTEIGARDRRIVTSAEIKGITLLPIVAQPRRAEKIDVTV